MKNYTFLLRMLLMSILFSCQTSTETKDNETAESITEKAASPARTKIISMDQFNVLNKKYGDYVKELNSFVGTGPLNKRISRYHTYQIDSLIKSLNNLKDSFGATGVRIYLGMYPQVAGDGSTEDPDDKKVRGLTNLVFVGTKDSIMTHPDGVRKFRRRHDIIDRTQGLFAVGEVVGFNEGTICPPPPGCKGIGAKLIDDTP